MHEKIARLVGTKRFFGLIVALFVIEAGWIALSAGYPGIFDENTHLAIIKLYAQQWSPFFSHQPAGSDALGALTRDPSYLYHYVMSFPYRFISSLTSNQMTQIISLRFIDIGLFTGGICVFRKILLQTKAPAALVNTCLLFFILIPVVPFLAAQINYDDLLIPLAGLSIYSAIRFKQELDLKRLSAGFLLSTAGFSMLACLVQFEALPIFAALEAYIAYCTWMYSRTLPSNSNLLDTEIVTKRLKRLQLRHILTLLLFTVSLGLFSRAYIVNVINYHNPVPACNQVLTDQECSADGTWLRSYQDTLDKVPTNNNVFRYAAGWLYRMGEYAFYANSGGSHTDDSYVDISSPPIIIVTAVIAMIFGLLFGCVYAKEIFKDYSFMGLILYVGVVYVCILFTRNYLDFLQTGQKIAINSRYLLPVILPVELYSILGYQKLLANKPAIKSILLVVAFLLCLQGGGTLTFINVSNKGWYWPNDQLATNMNRIAQKVTRPLIFH